jgi:acetyltransferase-like isoleucine patch superfamily enzyme
MVKKNKIILVIRRAFRSIIYRYDKIIVRIYLQSIGVKIGQNSIFLGFPEVTCKEGSKISIGGGGLFISRGFSTALGINHPIILRTLTSKSEIIIGNNVGISGGTICAAKRITIGDECMLGADVLIADTDFHSIHPILRKDNDHSHDTAREVCLKNNVFIGTRSIILKGVTIGENSVIGAGSVVTRSIPSNVIAAGNPCTVIRKI